MTAATRQHETDRGLRSARAVAFLLAGATLLLIAVGGLVTTYQAGMAVPDWPNTYGYNLFLYPWQTWIAGPWDLFVEHGHRLLGAAVGLLTLTLAFLVWRSDVPPFLRRLTFFAVALVLFQGTLGGARVLLDRQLLALLHGCTAPIFLATVAAIALFLHPRSVSTAAPSNAPAAARLANLSCITAALIYIQIVFGASIRHISPLASGDQFRIVVWFHLLLATAIVGHAAAIGIRVVCTRVGRAVRRHAWLLLILVAAQIGLGLLTWVVQFGFPGWLASYQIAASHTIESEGLWQTTITTLHVVTGSALLAASVALAIRAALESGSLPWSAGAAHIGRRVGNMAWEGRS